MLTGCWRPDPRLPPSPSSSISSLLSPQRNITTESQRQTTTLVRRRTTCAKLLPSISVSPIRIVLFPAPLRQRSPPPQQPVNQRQPSRQALIASPFPTSLSRSRIESLASQTPRPIHPVSSPVSHHCQSHPRSAPNVCPASSHTSFVSQRKAPRKRPLASTSPLQISSFEQQNKVQARLHSALLTRDATTTATRPAGTPSQGDSRSTPQ